MALAEYLLDYAPENTAKKGWKVIEENMESLNGFQRKDELLARIEKIKAGERDLYF